MTLFWITIRFYGTWRWRGGPGQYANKSRQAAFYCSRPTGALIEVVIRELCTDNDWLLFDCVVMPSHIHLVFQASKTNSRTAVLQRIKSRITKSLRAAAIVGPSSRVWSKGNDRFERHPMSELPRLMAYCAKNRRERDA